jgi:transposase
VDQLKLFEPVPLDKLSLLSKEELIEFYRLEQELRIQFQNEAARLRSLNDELKQKHLYLNEQYVTLKNKFFGKSSESEPSEEDRRKAQNKKNRKKKKRVLLPSERYPDAPLIEREVELETLPECGACGHEMSDSGMTENSEFLTVVPAQYIVIRQKRHKYRCGHCHGAVKTAPAPPRICTGSGYSDEMIVDVALSKYCDLIPIDRYSSIAGRAGLNGIPPNSLIAQTHHLADFVTPVYEKLKNEVLSASVLHADETPHRMLEENGGKSWYLWGFSTAQTSYFEIHNTRSGDVVSELLDDSKCEFLVSDVFSGYRKSVRETNIERSARGQPLIQNVYCNAHARRKFKGAKTNFHDEADYFVKLYKKIYRLEEIAQKRPQERNLRVRGLMKPLFEQMKKAALEQLPGFSTHSSIGVAMSYFLKNYHELTLFVENADLPIDNNPQERQLRNPVVGRKTWYGTHSKRGARTAAILFSLVESCKLCGINPRDFFRKLVEHLHQGKAPFTPKEFQKLTQQ